MAFHTNQSYLLGVLCIVLIIISGFIPNLAYPPDVKCTYPCTATCDRDCRAKGFMLGLCDGDIRRRSEICCCYK
ncbi:hypothetical protein P8452_35339 [Trifolium repens]|nr:hypothetical protein P8452_35339 [Trifolium repens]